MSMMNESICKSATQITKPKDGGREKERKRVREGKGQIGTRQDED